MFAAIRAIRPALGGELLRPLHSDRQLLDRGALTLSARIAKDRYPVATSPTAVNTRIAGSEVKRSSRDIVKALHVPTDHAPTRYTSDTVSGRCNPTRLANALHADLGNATSVDGGDDESVTLDVDGISDLRDAAKASEHHAANRVV